MDSVDKQRVMIEHLNKQNKGQTLDLKVPNRLQNKCLGYSGIFEDLKTCQEALKLLEKSVVTGIIEKSLFTTIIVLYGKCFTESIYVKLEKSIFCNNLFFLKLHDELMELRHKFIAHREITDHYFGQAFLQVNPVKMQGNIIVGHYNTTSFPSQRVQDYFMLIDFLILEVRKKFSANEKKVAHHIFQKISIQEFKDLLINK